MSGGKQKTQTVTTAPWEPQQGPIKDGLNAAGNIFDNGSTQAAGQFAQQGLMGLAQAGAPNIDAANGYIGGLINGDMLNSNPHLNAAIQNATQPLVDQFQSATMPGLQSGYASAGRFGSDAMEQSQTRAMDSLGRAIGNTAENMAFQNYGMERNFQQQAAQMAPGMYQAQQLPYQTALNSIGAAYAPVNAYMDVVGKPYGSEQTMPAGSSGGPLAGALGGAQLGSMFGPIGTGIGAIGGGLLGLF